MRDVFRQEGIKVEPHYTIDTKGVIIFRLPNGGSIRDTGAEVHYTIHNEQAKNIASKLAQSKWGNNTQIEGGVVKSMSLVYTPHLGSHSNGLN